MDFTTTHTTCPYCACGCGLLLEVLDGRIVSTLPSKTNATNKGKLCIKGWNVHEFVQHPTRLQKPLLRQNGSFREISWDEEYPFWMTTGTEFAHYLTGTMTRRCVTLDRELPELVTELNPEDGRRLRIGQGEILRGEQSPGNARFQSAAIRSGPTGHDLHAAALRGGGSQSAHESRLGPHQQDAGIQGLRGQAGKDLKGIEFGPGCSSFIINTVPFEYLTWSDPKVEVHGNVA